jgi:Leucine-rich repeat (LRR) protein
LISTRLGGEATEVQCNFVARVADYVCAVRGDATVLSKTTIDGSFSFSGDHSAKTRTTWIEFSRVGKVAHIPWTVTVDFPKLTILSITDSQLPIVRNDLLKQQFNRLQKLNLYSNGIQIIEEQAFAHLENLQGIFLHNNQIQSLSGRLFENNRQLKLIFLMKNKIKMIESGTFKHLNHLEGIMLSGNACSNQQIGCSSCRRKIDAGDLDGKLRGCYDDYKKGLDFLNEGR